MQLKQVIAFLLALSLIPTTILLGLWMVELNCAEPAIVIAVVMHAFIQAFIAAILLHP